MDDDLLYVVNVEAAVFRDSETAPPSRTGGGETADGEYLLAERSPEEDHAAATLSLVGGKVEGDETGEEVLERTVRRELREEVGVAVDALEYVTSNAFVADTGTPVVNTVFLARYADGEVRAREPDEVAAVHWRTPDAVLGDDEVPVFVREYVERAEARRQHLGW